MIHRAGPLEDDGVQRCTRCGYILTDYRGAMVEEGSGPLQGWQEGAAVEVSHGNPTFSGVTDDPPDCSTIQ
jgi:hypothetical protein